MAINWRQWRNQAYGSIESMAALISQPAAKAIMLISKAKAKNGNGESEKAYLAIMTKAKMKWRRGENIAAKIVAEAAAKTYQCGEGGNGNGMAAATRKWQRLASENHRKIWRHRESIEMAAKIIKRREISAWRN